MKKTSLEVAEDASLHFEAVVTKSKLKAQNAFYSDQKKLENLLIKRRSIASLSNMNNDGGKNDHKKETVNNNSSNLRAAMEILNGLKSEVFGGVAVEETPSNNNLSLASPIPPPPPTTTTTTTITNNKTQQPPTPTTVAGTSYDLSTVLQRRKQFENLKQQTKTLDNNKAIKQAKLHISMLSQTQKDVLVRFSGTPQNIGPKRAFDMVNQTAPHLYDLVMHVLAERIVQVAGSNTAPDLIRRGESNFALVYMSFMLIASEPRFTDHLLSSLEYNCPYIAPGLKQEIEATCTKENRKVLLGYASNDESDDDYVLRMQAFVAFYGALLQTNWAMLSPYNIPQRGWVNPFGGLSEAWRFIARHLNSPVLWRWTRYLLQAFLAVVGFELSAVVGKQTFKLIEFLLSNKDFHAACELHTRHPQDDDRINIFVSFLKRAHRLNGFEKPGKAIENDTLWSDPRVLPMGVVDNYG